MTRDEVRTVLDRVRSWPYEQQAVLARVAELIEAQREPAPAEDDETRSAIAEGLVQARRGQFASPEQVEAAFAKLGARFDGNVA